MASQSVGIREFRDNLATYILGATSPITITRHGDTVGVFFPTRPKRTEAQKAAFREATEKIQVEMDALGITEEDIAADLERLHAEKKRLRALDAR